MLAHAILDADVLAHALPMGKAMSVKITQVDAFADRPFAGNPAAVCVLSEAASAEWMQKVAREMNLSETAFLRWLDAESAYELRWFTPTVEVELCGHATLAAAHVLWEEGHLWRDDPARFVTRSGPLSATCMGEEIELDFPSRPVSEAKAPPDLLRALGCSAVFVGENGMDLLVQVETEAEVRSLRPDFGALARVPVRGVIVTSRSQEFDFVSRFFAPASGIDEDPVTGS